MGETVASKIGQPIVPTFEKVLSENALLAEKFLGAFKRIISISVVPEIAKDEIKQATKEYIQTSLQDVSIDLPNLDALTSFLIKHIDSVQAIIAVCHEVKNYFPKAKEIKLLYEVETEDSSGEENITLYVQVDKNFSEANEQLKKIVIPYNDYFIDSGVLFTAQIDIK